MNDRSTIASRRPPVTTGGGRLRSGTGLAGYPDTAPSPWGRRRGSFRRRARR